MKVMPPIAVTGRSSPRVVGLRARRRNIYASPNRRFPGSRSRTDSRPNGHPVASAGPSEGRRWRHWRALHSTRLSGLVPTMSRQKCQTHVIYRVSPSPIVGSSGSHCTKLVDDQHMCSRAWASARARSPPP